MLAEVQALHHNHTWDLVPPFLHRHALPCKLVYHIKRNSNDSLETFNHVVKHVIVHIILSLAFSRQCGLFANFDVTNAFIHGYLFEEVYMH